MLGVDLDISMLHVAWFCALVAIVGMFGTFIGAFVLVGCIQFVVRRLRTLPPADITVPGIAGAAAAQDQAVARLDVVQDVVRDHLQARRACGLCARVRSVFLRAKGRPSTEK